MSLMEILAFKFVDGNIKTRILKEESSIIYKNKSNNESIY
jgi:hypothetical protein